VVSGVIGWLRALVGLFLLGLLFVLLFPGFSRRTVDSLRRRPWASLGTGLGVLILVPIIAAIVFVAGLAIGGWWLGGMALAIYTIAAVLSIPVAGLFVGRWILNRAGRGNAHSVWAMLLGTASLMLVSLVPVVGGIVLFLALLFGLGGLAIAATQRPRTPEPALRAAPGMEPSRGDVAA
jgi:hypothetical protein